MNIGIGKKIEFLRGTDTDNKNEIDELQKTIGSLKDEEYSNLNEIDELKKKIDFLKVTESDNIKKIQILKDEIIIKSKSEMINKTNYDQLNDASKLSLTQLFKIQKKLEDEYLKNLHNNKLNKFQTEQIDRAKVIIGNLLSAVKDGNQK